MPFSLTVPKEPTTLDSMSEEEFTSKLRHSYEQSLAGEGRPYVQVFDELERELQ